MLTQLGTAAARRAIRASRCGRNPFRPMPTPTPPPRAHSTVHGASFARATTPAPPSNPATYFKEDPASRLRIHDPGFLDVLGENPTVEQLVTTDAHEGPVYLDNALYFTTVPAASDNPMPGTKTSAIRRLDLGQLGPDPVANQAHLSTLRIPSNMANGMTSDAAGNLIVCEQGSKTAAGGISRLNPATLAYEKLVDEWFGLPFNSPNDVVVKSDGSIWFTDPAYGYVQGFKPEPMVGSFVYRFNPAGGQLTVVADSFNRPNGLAFSPDESVLYINDSGANQGAGPYHPELPHHIRAFDLGPSGATLGPGRLVTVVSPGIPDGLKVDAAGRIYSSSADGVQVFTPDGVLLGLVEVHGVANFCFGGPCGNVLYMMADTAIWTVDLKAVGAAFAQ
eukprot:m.441110 g.441110  ORF g.441110 m.441110 type:complete len:392 (-) comp18617_c0_seq1:93-1268(-)